MEFRNAFYSRADQSAIDMEIEHPVFGWLQTTTSPNDVEEHSRDLFAAAVATGNVAPYVPPAPPAATVDDVAAERDRRLSSGLRYDFGDERGIHQLGTTDADMRRWMDEVNPLAQACINIGQPEATIGISTNTGPATITAMEWQHILIAAGQHRQPLYAASFALQAMDPIPADYADDQHWPSSAA